MTRGVARWAAAGVLGAAAIGGAAAWQYRVDLRVPPAVAAATSTSADHRVFSERAVRDTQIAVWNQALDADPVSALAMGHLAALHLQRAREGGTWDDYLQSEQLARRSLALRTVRNAATAVTLTQALLAQHRFTEALDVAKHLLATNPHPVEYHALLGEVAMEIGEDSLADAMFRYAWSARRNLSVAPRLARWLEVTNRVEEARRVMRAARDEAVGRRDLSRETKAWFEMRVGDIEQRAGRPRAAVKAYRAGLAIEPNDPRLLAAMARLSAAQDDPSAVITWGERAIAVQMEPTTLGLLAEAYAALGDSAKSAEYDQVLTVVAAAQPGAFHRAWNLYLLDHGHQIEAVVAAAMTELATRKDVYGYDLAAWAMYRAGRFSEARRLMSHALRLDTPDPLLARHARQINAAPSMLATRR